jgi:hypothetical protein
MALANPPTGEDILMIATVRFFAVLLLTATLFAARAGEVTIEFATLTPSGDSWDISVRLRHDDAGWDHYADEWRVVDSSGEVLGRRVLYHPHVDEQPFTRSQAGIRIPPDASRVYIEAHDTVHGWSPDRLEVDPARPEGSRYRISGN